MSNKILFICTTCIKQIKKLQAQKISKFTAIHITAGDRDRTFLRLANTDRKEAGGFT